jgi:hypothetical protein
MKVCINEGELYPYYDLDPKYGVPVKLTPAELEDVQYIMEEFKRVQLFLERKLEERSDAGED